MNRFDHSLVMSYFTSDFSFTKKVRENFNALYDALINFMERYFHERALPLTEYPEIRIEPIIDKIMKCGIINIFWCERQLYNIQIFNDVIVVFEHFDTNRTYDMEFVNDVTKNFIVFFTTHIDAMMQTK